MELLWLRYFQSVVQEGSMSAAARKLHIAQPAISQTIAKLENELGTQLFIRNGKKLIISNTGKIFLRRVNQCLNALDTGIREVINPDEVHTIKILIRQGFFVFADVVNMYSAINPSVKFEFIQDIESDEDIICDFILDLKDVKGKSAVVGKRELVAVMSEQNALASKHLDWVNKSDISKYTYIQFENSNLKDKFEKSENFTEIIGISPKMIVHTSRIEVIKSWLHKKNNVTICSKTMLDYFISDGLTWKKIESEGFTQQVYLIINNEILPDSDAEKFWLYIQSILS